MSTEIPVDVVTVFTNEEGAHGNPLGLIRSTAATSGREQELATRLGFSETVFVDVLTETDAVGRVATIRIFTPVHELPFAGHPCVGTAWWLAQQGLPVASLAVRAGEVAVRYDGDLSWITGRAEWAPEFEWHQLASAAEVEALDPGAFATGKHYAWAWIDESAGHLRSRMFAPEFGIPEDEATGAAAVRITAVLGRDLVIDQGVGSRVVTRVEGDGRVSVGGRSVASTPVVLG
ncbi:PhzF family phenazine biosynthesis protein [Herbiconiux sp. YIM B11900]|uniref:PhzF family phenazine biosynthesis protein n=1 Tax=Herbiconiux sp. YIM B11900 TaxID=3404131 RepID=UPI003F84D3C1